MRFIVDECSGPAVVRWLSENGHDVFSVYDEARGLSDDAILDKAVAENWINVTNDRDFGEKVFRSGRAHGGVVYLRLQDERAARKIEALASLLRRHLAALEGAFVVVTESQVRFAGPPSKSSS